MTLSVKSSPSCTLNDTPRQGARGRGRDSMREGDRNRDAASGRRATADARRAAEMGKPLSLDKREQNPPATRLQAIYEKAMQDRTD